MANIFNNLAQDEENNYTMDITINQYDYPSVEKFIERVNFPKIFENVNWKGMNYIFAVNFDNWADRADEGNVRIYSESVRETPLEKLPFALARHINEVSRYREWKDVSVTSVTLYCSSIMVHEENNSGGIDADNTLPGPEINPDVGVSNENQEVTENAMVVENNVISELSKNGTVAENEFSNNGTVIAGN